MPGSFRALLSTNGDEHGVEQRRPADRRDIQKRLGRLVVIAAHRIQNSRVIVERHHFDEGIAWKLVDERSCRGNRLVQQAAVHAPTAIDQ